MTAPGRLKTRLAIQAPVEMPDGQGGFVRNYATAATVWASVMPAGGRTAVEAGAAGAVAGYRIILRSNFTLTLLHRLADGARVYRIVSIRDRDDKRFVEIAAELQIG